MSLSIIKEVMLYGDLYLFLTIFISTLLLATTSIIWDLVLALIPSYSIYNISISNHPYLQACCYLCLSGIAPKLAVTQAESKYHQAKIASKIKEHFTGSYEEYSTEQFIGFLMDTNIGLSNLSSIRIIADAAFRVINRAKIGTLYVKKRLP